MGRGCIQGPRHWRSPPICVLEVLLSIGIVPLFLTSNRSILPANPETDARPHGREPERDYPITWEVSLSRPRASWWDARTRRRARRRRCSTAAPHSPRPGTVGPYVHHYTRPGRSGALREAGGVLRLGASARPQRHGQFEDALSRRWLRRVPGIERNHRDHAPGGSRRCCIARNWDRGAWILRPPRHRQAQPHRRKHDLTWRHAEVNAQGSIEVEPFRRALFATTFMTLTVNMTLSARCRPSWGLTSRYSQAKQRRAADPGDLRVLRVILTSSRSSADRSAPS